MSVNEKMTAIADAIRDKTGETQMLTLDEMAENIPKVYDAGKKAQYDEFWDALQRSGTRTYYQAAFAYWDAEEINSKYDIKSQTLYEMFSNCRKLKNIPQNIVSTRADGAFLSAYYFVRDCGVLKSVDMDLVFAGYAASTVMYGSFYNCSSLERIQKIVSKADMGYGVTFLNCHRLVDITFEGEIGQNINFQWSPLNKASITSVINALSGTATGYTVTFKKTAVNEAFGIDVDDEAAFPEGSEYYELRSSKSNWTFSYV